jgi:hypothetical protein
LITAPHMNGDSRGKSSTGLYDFWMKFGYRGEVQVVFSGQIEARPLPGVSHHYAGVALAWHPCRR